MDLEAELGEHFNWHGKPRTAAQERAEAVAKGRKQGEAEAKRKAQEGPLAGLARALTESRQLLVSKAAAKDRAELAASQVEKLTDLEHGITAALLRGELDAATHATACRSLEAMRKQLWLFAERLDAQQWAARQAVPAIININSPIEGMSPADVAELVAEVKRIRQQRQALPGTARRVDGDAE